MDEITCARELGAHLNDLGGRFMLDSATFAISDEVGLEPVAFYLMGRFSPLGPLTGEEVADIALVFEPENFKDIWNQAASEIDLSKVGERYLQCCADWGRTNLSGKEGLQKFSDLAEKVIESVDAPHAPLFGALKGMQRPDDVEGKAAVVAYMLRELKFSHHAKFLKESDVSVLDAILLDAGEPNAKMFMWPEPFEKVEDGVSDLLKEVKEKATELSAQDFKSLDESERQELVDSVKQIQAALSSN